MQSIMVMSTKGDNMGIFKKIWHWLFGKKEVDKWEEYKARKLEEINALKKEVGDIKRDLPKYASGGYIKNAERYVAPRYSEATSNNIVTRNNNNNFLMGAMVGYVIADSLNDSPSARDIEVPKSSNYESSYTPISSSSYDSGSYSSSSDSGSSSSSCDSGC